MNPLRRQSLIEQTAAHLTERLHSAAWAGSLPGVNRLSAELDVSRETVRAAIRQLQDRGLLAFAGAGRSRQVTTRSVTAPTRNLRVGILLNRNIGDESAATQALLLQLQHAIQSGNHICFLANKSQAALQYKLKSITRFIKTVSADVWIVFAGSLELLQWFAGQATPSIALGGRNVGVPIASVGGDVTKAISDTVDHLTRLNHKRIVFITPAYWRKPHYGLIAKFYADQLSAHGIQFGDYNLPDWEETPEGLQTLLNSLFHVTPPTAILLERSVHAFSVMAFLAERRLQIGRDVSLLCMQSDPVFSWHSPPIAHFHWHTEDTIRQILRWIGLVARGHNDRKQRLTRVALVVTPTLAPAR